MERNTQQQKSQTRTTNIIVWLILEETFHIGLRLFKQVAVAT